jgi:hypothetical protein
MKMKQIVTLLFAVCLAAIATAQNNIMLCNASGNTCTAYSSLQDAYTAATNGDVIYLPAGGFNMPSPINKEISIYGVGASADSSMAYGGITIINNEFAIGANNITLQGLRCAANVRIGNGTLSTLTGVKMLNCRLVTLEHAAASPYGRLNNSQIIGCFFDGYLSCGTDAALGLGDVQASQGANNFISNCVVTQHLVRLQGSTVNNCIINGVGNPYCPYCINAVFSSFFNKCVFFNGSIAYGGPNNGIDYSVNNNLLDCYYQDNSCSPQPLIGNCVQFNNTNLYSNYPFSLIAGSGIPPFAPISFPVGLKANLAPGIPSDLGIKGGLMPYTECVPTNPHIYFKNIANSTNSSGLLPVQIKVRSGN